MDVVLKDDFPNSEADPFLKTSEVDTYYNCIAWAAGNSTNWYEPDPGGLYYWPSNVPREYTVDAYTQVYEDLGYEKCENGDLEEEFEKVAVFAKRDFPTHASKQLDNGLWSSKLGINIDVSHSINAIENGRYGDIIQFLRRRKIANNNIVNGIAIE